MFPQSFSVFMSCKYCRNVESEKRRVMYSVRGCSENQLIVQVRRSSVRDVCVCVSLRVCMCVCVFVFVFVCLCRRCIGEEQRKGVQQKVLFLTASLASFCRHIMIVLIAMQTIWSQYSIGRD